MREIIKEKENQILIGAATLVILLILMGAKDFYTWLGETLLGYLASIFFIMPIVKLILTLKPTKELIISAIGIIILAIYMTVLNLTIIDIIIIILQTIVILSLVTMFLPKIKNIILNEILE